MKLKALFLALIAGFTFMATSAPVAYADEVDDLEDAIMDLEDALDDLDDAIDDL